MNTAMAKAKVEAGTYTPETDEYASQVSIAHGLGAIPDFVIVMSDAFTAEQSYTVNYIGNSYCSKTNLSASNLSFSGVGYYLKSKMNDTTIIQSYEQVAHTKFLSIDSFKIPYYYSADKLKAGVTYHYLVGIYS